jgi:hypothetical protein
MVSCLPFSRIQIWLARWSRRRDPRYGAARIGWAVNAASRFVPGADCLPRAVAAFLLLKRNGRPATLVLGARASSSGCGFGAHAWTESQGVMVVGGARAAEFHQLLRLGE